MAVKMTATQAKKIGKEIKDYRNNQCPFVKAK
jgi:hypothetical protein